MIYYYQDNMVIKRITLSGLKPIDIKDPNPEEIYKTLKKRKKKLKDQLSVVKSTLSIIKSVEHGKGSETEIS